jgi:hypothetical protein
MTEACERWDIALEKERSGELSPDERAKLDEHLATCAPCREERSAIARIAEEMQAPQASPSVGWDDLHMRVEHAVRSQRRDRIIGLVAALAAGAALVLVRGFVTGRPFDSFGTGIAAGVAFPVMVLGIRAFLTSRRLRAGAPGTDLIEEIRREYRRRLRFLRFFAVVGPLYVAFLVASSTKYWGSGTPSVALRATFVLGVVALALNGWFRVKPRLERELRSVEGR